MDLTLETPVQYIPRVGPAMAERLEKLEIRTVEDLLYQIPSRYNDFSLISNISQIQPGETVTIHATIELIRGFYTKTGKQIQEAQIRDVTGTLKVIWFNQRYLLKMLKEGDTVSLSGQITWFGHAKVMSSPQFEILDPNSDTSRSLHTGRLVPIYHETEGVSSKWIRGRVAHVLQTAPHILVDFLSKEIIASHSLVSLSTALSMIHFPDTLEDANRAKHRLSFDELLLIHLQAQIERRLWEKNKTAPRLGIPISDFTRFNDSLPFVLTDDQKQASKDIVLDISNNIPMRRLMVGDVGSGKTVVAAIAMYAAYKNGFDSMLMAPTEILAQQHFKTISQFLAPLGIRTGLVTGSTKPDEARHLASNGQLTLGDTEKLQKLNVLVGTHALLTTGVATKKLGLVVIDEQHRFGVHQRAKLLKSLRKGLTPHLLTMTATPIPRTIARTMFGSLDVSILNQMPTGRKKIKTWVVPKEKREKAYSWIQKEMDSTRGQAFFLYPFIDESETLASVKAVMSEYSRVKKQFPGVPVGLLHGRMKTTEKNKALDDFRNQNTRILVTTPVVEVGIDIANATIMLIDGADRFGLGQLHQLRGRVGRSDKQSYCLLFTEQDNEMTLKRLKALESIYSGPQLAEVDLQLRGPGELFGTRQHGIPALRIASFADNDTIEETKIEAKRILKSDENLDAAPLLREKLQKGTIERAED